MDELAAILDVWRTAGAEERDAVLATVVHVEGSAYRRPGARMLILGDGRRIGSISGGCLEGEVSRKAWWFTKEGQAALRVYDTTSEDDAVWEFGLGCNGIVYVLLERLASEGIDESLRVIDAARAARRPVVIATVIQAEASAGVALGDRLFVGGGGADGGSLVGSAWEDEVRVHAERAHREQRSRLLHLRDGRVFVEWVAPPLPLVVLGAGHDALPLVRMAKELGWEVTVADRRPAYARRDRFPPADRVALLPHGDDPIGDVDIGPQSVVVLMTHDFQQDVSLLGAVLPRRPRYLGLLGSARRSERLFAALGITMDRGIVHAPVGLDIGAESPEAIALAIVSEIQATVSGRLGGALQLRHAPIHEPVAEVGGEYRPPAPERAPIACDLAAHA